ncbi:MAG: NADH-quinone oxidoreductase subunit M [Rickettsiaceae bacterium]|nr:MAG: NADH-quinone oxidoreductase subunit M [Rickettsiaceae bacterium]
MSQLPILSISILLPLLSALYITFFISYSKSPNRQEYAIYVAILGAVFTLIATLYLLLEFDNSSNSYQFVERYQWVKQIGLEFHLGIDGISIYFVFLTALLTLICIITSLFTVKQYIKEFLFLFLLLEAFCIGAFCAQNLLLFFLFFEAVLIPMYLIIGIWGGENKDYAAIKFFIYTFLGSIFFLMSLIYIYIKTNTFDMSELTQLVPMFSKNTQIILFLMTFLAFAVKIPIPPFHTWLPDAHVQAPTSGSIMLAGILLKLGTYALLRISLPLLPVPVKFFSQYILIISAITIIYASFVALAQKDMKKMIAYSSIAHMGYVIGGIFSLTKNGINGAIFQMISHGIISSALFLIVGILYQRNHTKEIDRYGGVASKMPILAVFFMISILGSIGLPGTSGFIGEFFSLLGMFESNSKIAMLATSGMILGATYMLKLYNSIMLGKITDNRIYEFKDLAIYEVLALLPLVILVISLGVMPNTIVDVINLSTDNLVKIYQSIP